MKVYIGSDYFENRGYFVRKVDETGLGPIFNGITRKFEDKHDINDPKYFFKAQEIIDIINILRPNQVLISKSVSQIERDIIASNIVFNASEPAKDLFELGGAL